MTAPFTDAETAAAAYLAALGMPRGLFQMPKKDATPEHLHLAACRGQEIDVAETLHGRRGAAPLTDEAREYLGDGWELLYEADREAGRMRYVWLHHETPLAWLVGKRWRVVNDYMSNSTRWYQEPLTNHLVHLYDKTA